MTNIKLQTFIETELNEQQRNAVLQKNGCTLVIAGAGSGKTRVITARIAHLIVDQGINPHAIIALTFTNKAAKEMAERIRHFLPSHMELPFIGTFHGYCVKLLRMHADILELPFFTIIDADDQEKIISGILQRNNLNKQITVKQCLSFISSLKNTTLNTAGPQGFFQQQQIMRDVFQAYETEKKVSKCLDFDDLLHYGLALFTHATFKTTFQQRIRHILVDEYQDTNLVQHALLKAMTTQEKDFSIDSICVVGDEDQSIYSWRGATIANMINFRQDFPQNTIIKLEQNYRSVQPILDIANTVIQHNKQRNPKKLWSTKQANEPVISITCNSEYQEGDIIVELCKILQKKSKLGSCAVLYRTHFQSRAIEEVLIKHAIAYKIIGGIQFYERKEIKDLLAYLRLIVNPFDRPSFWRIINIPARGLGQAFQDQMYEQWNDQPFLTYTQIIEKMLHHDDIKGKKFASLQAFITIFKDLSSHTAPATALQEIIQRCAYINYIKENYESDDAQIRIDNIHELMRAIEYFQTEQQGTLDQFLQEVALMQEKTLNQKEEQEALVMMTYHAAKGLEFDTVVLVGLEEGLLPSSRSLHDSDALEEERRLFYVGITRARERLLLSASRYRYTYGKTNTQSQSRFLNEIPEHLMKHYEVGTYLYTIKPIIAQWLQAENKPAPSVMTFAHTQSQAIPVTPSTPTWRINAPVKHATFGIGIIKQIEQKNSATYVSVQFKTGVKKVLSSFLSPCT